MEKLPKTLEDWLNKLETSHNKKIDLGLTRVKKVYENLQLDKIAPTIITVAGTNGKGSTVAILSSILEQSGISIGSFTSPHIIKFNERICINNKQVSDHEIVKAFELIEVNLKGVTLSYFEYATLTALILFKSHQVEVAVLEVGLGGRLDSVNVVDTDCAIITTIDIDHTEWLGNDIESIAYEKAGIMRSKKPIIYGDLPCPKSIIDYAKKINAQLILSDSNIVKQSTNLKGNYQQKNIKTALTAIKALNIKVDDKSIRSGLNQVKLNARLQTISEKPDVIIDVSHNKQAASELSQWLVDNPISGKTYAVFSVLNDKNVKQWLPLFESSIDVWCISQAKTERAMKRQDLILTLADYSTLITSYISLFKAHKGAISMSKKEDRIIVFGSFYTVGEVLAC